MCTMGHRGGRQGQGEVLALLGWPERGRWLCLHLHPAAPLWPFIYQHSPRVEAPRQGWAPAYRQRAAWGARGGALVPTLAVRACLPAVDANITSLLMSTPRPGAAGGQHEEPGICGVPGH